MENNPDQVQLCGWKNQIISMDLCEVFLALGSYGKHLKHGHIFWMKAVDTV